MRKALLTATALLLALPALAAEAPKANYGALDRNAFHQRTQDMLNVTVRVETATEFGSGTVIHSGGDGVFILTNHHVVANYIDRHTSKAALHKVGAKPQAPAPSPESSDSGTPPVDPNEKIIIRSWLTVDGQPAVFPIYLTAKIVASDAKADLALLKITDPEWRYPAVATFAADDDPAIQTEPVFVVGSGLGNRTFVTEGLVSLTNVENEAEDECGHIMVSAPIIMGNSGGGSYVERGGHYVMIGVPEAIASAGLMRGLVPHMGFLIRNSVIKDFLAQNGHGDFMVREAAL